MPSIESDLLDEKSIGRRQMLGALGSGGIIAITGCLGGGDGDGNGGDGGGGGGGGGSDQQTIQFLTMGVGDNIRQFFEENNAAFEEEHDVNLEFTSVTWDNAQQTVNNRVDGGEAPDVARWPARWIPQLVGKDALVPIDDLMESDWGDRFYDGMAEGCTYQGSYYGAPWAASNKCLYYNKDVFEAAGLDPENPQLDTWDDMLSAAQQIRDEADTPPLGLAGADAIETGSQYYHYHWSYGADLIDDEGQPVVNSGEAVDALTFYSNLHLEHNVTQSSPLSSTRQDIRQLFETGGLGMVIAHVYTGINIDEAKDSGNVDFDYGIVQVPEGPGGRYSLNTIDAVSIFSQTEVQDVAEDLLRFYFQEDRHFEYATSKGFMPTMEAVGERDYFQDSENWAPYIEAGQYARARPKLPNFNEFNNRMVQAIQEALGDRKSPKQALDDAQSDLEDAME
ncbi:ABC-type glycerol-3-phosphate transport system, substrate-binding protein [Halopelagius inordinatus]|uniref:ABC-type glycerol-3-phosphate transport system, substrate-binding protein n=1 Tax=Halopelagius inordinatus TaxID=553467 RepID=A0A1I2UB95_9EURY|nr:ABC-type glycerol-3-phosphate transport system, substrate-binding protein [Halopelagius inordinatus]